MLSFRRRASTRNLIADLHTRVVELSRDPSLYLRSGMPDSVEGRFESLTLHVLLVLRRLRHLPPPAGDVAQELVDAVFAHLEVALREIGIGDFGVPKRMKKLGQAFYDRTSGYDRLLDAGEPKPLAAAIAERLGTDPVGLVPFAEYALKSEALLSRADLDAILAAAPFAAPEGVLEDGR